jgi:hypothetical protein
MEQNSASNTKEAVNHLTHMEDPESDTRWKQKLDLRAMSRNPRSMFQELREWDETGRKGEMEKQIRRWTQEKMKGNPWEREQEEERRRWAASLEGKEDAFSP